MKVTFSRLFICPVVNVAFSCCALSQVYVILKIQNQLNTYNLSIYFVI